MGHIKVSTAINAPVDRVVEVASDPRHWASWWVNLGEAEKIEGDGGVGTVYNVPGKRGGKVRGRTHHRAHAGMRPRADAREPQAPGRSRPALTQATAPGHIERNPLPA